MTRARSWEDLLLVAFAVALTGWGVHGLLQRDTAQRAERTAVAAAEAREVPAAPETKTVDPRPVVRAEPRHVRSAARDLPPSSFDPEFRDPAELDTDYALFLEELEARETAEDEAAELFDEAAFEPELSEAELEAFDYEELERELENYDAFLAELAEDTAAGLSERRR